MNLESLGTLRSRQLKVKRISQAEQPPNLAKSRDNDLNAREEHCPSGACQVAWKPAQDKTADAEANSN